MAETLINLLLERLASVTVNRIGRELQLVIGVDDEVANLSRNLRLITNVLQDAERQVTEASMGEVTGASVGDWLNELNQVSHEMDDVLDEWCTEILKHEQEGVNPTEALEIPEGSNKGGIIETAPRTKEKVCLPLPSCFSCCRVKQVVRLPVNIVRRVVHRRDIAVKIQSLNEKLTRIANERQRYNFQDTKEAPKPPPRQLTSSLVIDKSFGRKTEKDLLVGKLLDESSSHKRGGPLIIPIIGLGGIGRTTLCQLVYNDDMVNTYFDKKIWVCVSDPFEEIKIAKAIIEGLDNVNNTPNSNQLDPFMVRIKELIKGKKFLLVLDDVWNPNSSQWNELIKPLLEGATGSRILVTTRKEEVAQVMGATNQMIHLKALSEECTRELFNHITFLDREDEFEKFEMFVQEFVEKCKGLPLVAKTLGSLMRHKKTKKEWQDVLQSPIWELKKIPEEVFQPLLLSYYDLSPTIRRCLLYCVTFPKDHVIDKEVLIELWMSQDYLYKKQKKEDEVGQTYFEELAMRSFFQDFERDDDGNVTKCKMHDIMHDLLQFLTKEECFSMEVKGADEMLELPSSNSFRHFTLMFASQGLSSILSSQNCGNLRTFTTFASTIYSIEPEFITSLKRVRTLNLSSTALGVVPKEVGELLHLRYLDLSDNGFMELPDKIGDLYNLQTLRLVRCYNLLKGPDLRKLINLKHLYVQGSLRLESKGISRLKSLQTLDEFHVSEDTREEGLLEDLENLDKLQGALSMQHLASPLQTVSGAKRARLNTKRLLHLELNFRCDCRRRIRRGEAEGAILNALKPHPDLESLSILGCRGATSTPTWLMSLPNLKRLTLYIRYLEDLPALGTLSFLESLDIKMTDKLQKVGVEFLGINRISSSSSSEVISFPKLKHLTFSFMDEWKEWEEVDSQNIRIMPCLSSLEVRNCRKLKALPEFLWKTPLKSLTITSCPILHSVYYGSERCHWTTYGEKPAPINEGFNKISHIPEIRIGYEF
ncbi:putative EF-hand domain pair, P-loop containing nucleoside triphosphate hydrolase [Rosa chinensis]|uniref:Putative EF-hand domain pair, P-loop containing nucleoside triphosphate hydrolase n=1 Tax=Rosa chinensis TaxID=74649 RepID=A0A2P6RXR7_ROSCH|nr:putative disease resistance protein RGA4 isoform X1 [Rosa chinensis]XP_024181662.1 putative disease resistance protein RGA4 isoform X1 [Rosa chinensis]XP_024181663.1 putative disease resistance protein RGA4 isoform X1 [Rosa chinensis]XP_024181664.1 putative disease resistance protein RGA4 isoform X1 [Rosa chinensis]XP_040369700.1 putative disease resistance protein RGA4 isoform X1 [Rosa chinensis]XP_040369701.1 putative disease resistance protein RGA4 isoform X1 [Rosa chinensis]XP_04036970